MKNFRWKSFSGRITTLLVLALLLPVVAMVCFCFGSMRIAPADIPAILWRGEPLLQYRVLVELRLPRLILAALVGGCFAVSGAILQGIMRNPLASPDILGISAGGGLAGVLIMLVFPAAGLLILPCSFAGALCTALLIYALAWKRGVNPTRLILSGVAVASMLGAFSSAILLFNSDRAGRILDFVIGSLSSRGWSEMRQAGYFMLPALVFSCFMGGKLNILALGDDTAAGLGMKVEKVRLFLISCAALLAAAAVCVAGLLGFVGLIAPHLVRLAIGADNRFLLPSSALTGAILVIVCDTVGRTAASPVELPAGIILSLLGPPFFLWLLRRTPHEA